MARGHHSCDPSDAALLDMLTGPSPPIPLKTGFARRDAALDPLLFAAAAASGPNVTRNHYTHDFFPGVMLPQAEGAWDWTKWKGEDAGAKANKRLTYVSRQAPRSKKLQGRTIEEGKENDQPTEGQTDPLTSVNVDLTIPHKRRSSIASSPGEKTNVPLTSPRLLAAARSTVEVKCMARTRIPTAHGTAFLHLYHNNRDQKEHLAIVIDPAQLSEGDHIAPSIRSRSLDAVWSDNETEMDRITRGAYVGRLSPTSHAASAPHRHSTPLVSDSIPSPLIRIHSECFTGETVGSMRCDCGEQLDEAIRLISQPIILRSPTSPNSTSTTIPGRGAVIYLRQEGRGIGLLSKIRAYNLQDLGHDTVTANLMLGHQADERDYEIAGSIMRDLGLGSEVGEGVRLLTNNPEKVHALEKEGVRIVERVPMIPKSWQSRSQNRQTFASLPQIDLDRVTLQQKEDKARITGGTMGGEEPVHGKDLDKYLRTKVLRMGHMLPLYLAEEP
jgi:GTP cyclohydrolase II